jgi:hypothetical protein
MRLVVLILLALHTSLCFAAPAVGYVIAAIVAYEGYVQLAIMIAMAVYGYSQQKKAQRQAMDDWYAGLRDRTITGVASDNPYVYVYGRAMVGGTIVALFNGDTAGTYKYAVIVLAAHECDAIEEVYIAGHAIEFQERDLITGDVAIGSYFFPPTTMYPTNRFFTTSYTIPTRHFAGSVTVTSLNADLAYDNVSYSVSGTFVTGSTTLYEAGAVVTVSSLPLYYYTIGYAAPGDIPRVSIWPHLGIPGDTADPVLMAAVPDLWKSTATLTGFCYIVLKLHLAQTEFQTGMPSVTALVRGKKLFDPRSNTTYWNQNPALVAYDYLTSKFCGNISPDDLPLAEYITAANVCDEDHSVDSTIPADYGNRYTFNGTITADQQQASTLEAIAQSMAGTIVATTWSITAGKYVAPIMDLYQEDIVGKVGISPGLSDKDTFNGIKGRFSGSENNYAATDFTPYQDAGYLAIDGVAKWTNIDFPFTDSTLRIFNLSSIFIDDAQNAYSFTAEFGLKVWGLQIGDRITFTSTFLGFSSKVFRITDKKYNQNSAVQLTLKEDDPSIWELAATNIQTVLVPTIEPQPAPPAPATQTSFTLPTESILGTVSIIDSIPPVPAIYSVVGTLVPGTTNVYQAGATVTLDVFPVTTAVSNTYWCVYEAPGAPTQPSGPLPASNLPDPYVVDAIASLTLSSGNNDLLFMSDGTVVSRIYATWPESTTQVVITGGQIELQWMQVGSDVWHSFTTPGDQTNAYLSPVKDGQVYQVRIRAINTANNARSDWTYAAPHTVQGKSLPPADVTGFSYVLENFGITLSWTANTDPDLQGYEVRMGGTDWASSTLVTKLTSTHYFTKPTVSGNILYRIKAIDTSGNYSVNDAEATVVITVPPVVNVSAVVSGQNAVITWSPVVGSSAIDHYEIRYGFSFAAGTLLGKISGTTFSEHITYSGTRNYWVAAVDVAGNVGNASGTASITITAPTAPTVTSQVIDNNVLLFWTDATQTLPIATYEIRKGSVYASATIIGTTQSRFSALFENTAGSYTYWVTGIDSAGNYGTSQSHTATVNQPPDFVFRNNFNSSFSGTLSNALVESGAVILPVNTTETWTQHFSTRSWTDVQDQINAGYPIYIEPADSPGYYEETFDCGAALGSNKVTLSYTSSVIAGSPTVATKISLSPDNITYTDYSGVTEVYSSGFRYIKIRITVSGGSTDLLEISAINVKVDSKLLNDAGTVSALASDVGGTVVNFNVPFTEVSSITGTAMTTSPCTVVIDFTSVPNPTSFKVLVFDNTGTRVSASVSWAAKGNQ